jgi:hypothetical protein
LEDVVVDGRISIKMDITITVLDIVIALSFYLKHDDSETGFCLPFEPVPLASHPIGVVAGVRRQRLFLMGPSE